ncbi:hypothetical protein D3C80_478870 [compost metagenome]
MSEQRAGIVFMQHVDRLDLAIDRAATRQGCGQQVFSAKLPLAHRLTHGPGIQALILTVRKTGSTGIGKASEHTDTRHQGTRLEHATPGPNARRFSG